MTCAVRLSQLSVTCTQVSLAALLLTAGIIAPRSVAAQTRDSTFALADSSLVDVTMREGSLVVRGTAGRSAAVRSRGRSVSIRSGGAGVYIDGSGSRDRFSTQDGDEPRVELSVPRGARLVINAGRADIDVRDIDGDVQIRSSTGDIAMTRIGGRALVETLTGDIAIEGGVGALRATSSSGDVRAYGVRDGLVVRTTSGDVSVGGSGLSEAVIESISGEVSFDGGVVATGRLHVSTHSGDVELRLSDDTRGMLEFSTHHGELTTTLPLTTSGGALDSADR